MEKKKNRQEIYKGRVIEVVSDEVIIDEKKSAKREVVLHRGGACIALKDDDGSFFLVSQYRYAQGKEMLEFAAGKLEKGEDPDATIKRECREELGYEAENIVKFGSIVPTCGYSSEKIWLYYGEKGKSCGQNLDEDERIDVRKYRFDEIKEMIKEGVIDDAKTIALMYRIEMAGLNA